MVPSGHRSQLLAGSARGGPCLRFTFEETKVQITLGSPLVRGLRRQAPGCSEGKAHAGSRGVSGLPDELLKEKTGQGSAVCCCEQRWPVADGAPESGREPASGRPGAPRTTVSEPNTRPRGLTGPSVPEHKVSRRWFFMPKAWHFWNLLMVAGDRGMSGLGSLCTLAAPGVKG